MLSVSSNRVSIGSDVKLQWDMGTASSVHLLGWGEVSAKGSTSIKVTSSTNFVLVATTPAGSVLRAAKVEAVGAEGGGSDFEDDLGRFRYPYICQLTLKRTYDAFSDAVVDCIQGKLHAVQQTRLTPDGLQMETSHFSPPELQANLPEQYEARRISYLLDLPVHKSDDPAGHFRVTIKSFIEKKRWSEPDWSPEEEPKFYSAQSAKLDELLKGLV